MNMKKLSLLLALALAPISSFAALGNVNGLVADIGTIVNNIIPILFAVALLGFFYGLVKFIFGGEGSAEEAKKIMLWGIVALFVMASVWGLVNFLGTAVGVNKDTAPSVGPLIPKS